MGSGFRTFTAGEVLTASNVQNFLQNQSVMVFADSTARATDIGTANFEEGMLSYLEDTDQLEVYNGTAWASIAPTTNQGLTLINTTSFSAVASVAFPQDTFTSTFDHYLILGNYTSSSAALTNLTGRLMAAGSALTNANYDSTNANQDTNNAVSYQSQTSQTSWNVMQRLRDVPHRFEMILYGPKLVGTTPYNFRGVGINANNNALGVTTGGGNFSLTTSADSIQYLGATGTITGTISCYGFND
jgi:hypothetical protein